MVKGLSRKVIVVKSPDPKIFDQAIFIVRDDYLTTQGIDQKELLKQAQRAASGYVDRTYGWRRMRLLKPIALIVSAMVLVGLAITFGFNLISY